MCVPAREPMTQITEEVRDQLLEASAATRKAYNTYRREADPDDHYSAGEGAQSAADKSKDDLEMSAVISIMQPILRFLQLLCENHNRDLQVRLGSRAASRHAHPQPLTADTGPAVFFGLEGIQRRCLYLAEQVQEVPLSRVFPCILKGAGINT